MSEYSYVDAQWEHPVTGQKSKWIRCQISQLQSRVIKPGEGSNSFASVQRYRDFGGSVDRLIGPQQPTQSGPLAVTHRVRHRDAGLAARLTNAWAEAALEAANWRRQQAKAEYFPRLFLGALFGRQSLELNDFDLGSTRFSMVSGLITMPLFEYRCPACKSQFELLIRGSAVPACPSCGSTSCCPTASRPTYGKRRASVGCM